ncbi:hypothetical protein [Brevibacillus sp. 179-C9.3 HS]|uniref:hypothetical protein n=1 Tax=unclassified Brevibacillus TaxID=2684853 RepID=UPI0039A02BFA
MGTGVDLGAPVRVHRLMTSTDAARGMMTAIESTAIFLVTAIKSSCDAFEIK